MPQSLDLTVMREIAPQAKVSPEARVGPFCVIGPEVTIGPGTVLGRRVTVTGRSTLGRDNLIDDGCVLGAVPQDLKYAGRPTLLMIGDRNRLGPNVTAHVGTEPGGYLTRIGNDNVIESGAHVAHDCYVDERTRLAAGVLLGGHIRVETGAVIEELSGIHHFATVGRYSWTGSRTAVRRDVPPFTRFAAADISSSGTVLGVHEAGLAAAGLSPQERLAVRQAVQHLFHDEQALIVKVHEMLEDGNLFPAVRELCLYCLRTLAGRFGRHRETLRGKVPPEARQYLPPDVLAALEKERRG